MPRGRPLRSPIRQRVVEILHHMKKGYGYQIYQVYEKIYPRATLRSIYYHLNKGLQTGEFEVEKVQQEKGEYSWGTEAEKIYYMLGSNAAPKGDERVKRVLDEAANSIHRA